MKKNLPRTRCITPKRVLSCCRPSSPSKFKNCQQLTTPFKKTRQSGSEHLAAQPDLTSRDERSANRPARQMQTSFDKSRAYPLILFHRLI